MSDIDILDRIVFNTDSGIYWVYKQGQDGRYTIRERKASIPEIERVKAREESEEKVQASEEELDDYSSGVKSRINNLTKRFREEERQKQTAIEYAENVRKENEGLKERIQSLDKGYQEQFESRVSNQIDSAKEILRQAHETGDVDKIVEAQASLADLTVEKGTLKAVRAEKEEDGSTQETN